MLSVLKTAMRCGQAAGGGAGGGSAFVSPNGLAYFINGSGYYFEDSGLLTPALDDADGVGGWLNANLVTAATQTVSANEPELELVDASLNNKSSIICVDNQTTPTVAKWLDISSYLTTAMSSGLTCFAQVARPASQNSENIIFAEANALVFWLEVGSSSQVKLATQGLASPIVATPNPDVGVLYGCYDGTYLYIGWNDQEVAMEKPTGSWADISFTNGGTLRIGNYDNTTTRAARRIGKACPPISTVLTEAQRRSEARRSLSTTTEWTRSASLSSRL